MNRKTENLVSVVKGLRNELAELKGVQPMGADVIQIAENGTTNNYDFTLVAQGSAILTVTFTANTQKHPIGSVVAEVWRDGGSVVDYTFAVLTTPVIPAQETKLAFDVTVLANNVPSKSYWKIWVLASDRGNVEVNINATYP